MCVIMRVLWYIEQACACVEVCVCDVKLSVCVHAMCARVLFRLHREMHRALSLLPRNKKNPFVCA